MLWIAACGGDSAEAGASDSVAKPSVRATAPAERPRVERLEAPSYDPEARYDGKTLDEYAAGLGDLNRAVRLRAMGSVLRFGVNAYPLKERMRVLAVEDPDEEVRSAAFVALFEMKDPEASEFTLERLREPAAFESDRGWQMFLDVVIKGVDEDLLAFEAAELAANDPAHGESLLLVSGRVSRSGALRQALAGVLVRQPHGDETVAQLLGMIGSIGLSTDEQVDYVRDNHARLSNPEAALNTLRGIGSERAFEATLAILDETARPLPSRLQAINGFPAGGASAGAKLDEIAEFLPASTEVDVQQIFAAMQSVASAGQDPDVTGRFQAILVDLAGSGQAASVRALSMIYLADGLIGGGMSADALDPIFGALESDSTELVLGTALQELKKVVPRAPADLVPELPGRLVRIAYARPPTDSWSHAVTQGVFETFSLGLAKLGAKAVVTALAEQVEAHPGHRANFQMLQWIVPQSSQLQRLGASMPDAARLAGRLLVDGSMGAAQADWVYNSANMTWFNSVTRADMETIAAYYEPILMAGELPSHQYFTKLHSQAAEQTYHMRGNPELERYLAFLQRMSREAAPAARVATFWGLNTSLYFSYNHAERTGMAHFEHTLGGKPATIKPTTVGRWSKHVLKPAAFATGAEGEAFLLSRGGGSDSLGDIADLQGVYGLAFLDEAGAVMATARTDEPGLTVKQGRTLQLVQPEAQHALLFEISSFDLEVGDDTGLDPELLALL